MSSAGSLRTVILTAIVSFIVSSLAFAPLLASNVSTAQFPASSASEIHSDFNGDGYDDLAIYADTNQGTVHVLYGSSSGIQTSSPADQVWTSDSPGVNANGQSFGFSMAVGDYDGDGYSDLAAGVGSETVDGVSDAGAVDVIYGSSAGLRTSPASDGTGRTDQLWTQNSPGVEEKAEFFDLVGTVVASGNFNGDGFDDLAITALDEDLPYGAHYPGAVNNPGVVHVLYGSSSGLQAFSPPDQLWTQDSPGVEDVIEDSDSFGRTLAIGDFNGDGNDDLAVGVLGEGFDSVFGAGAVNVLYGSTSGLQTSSPPDQLLSQNSPGVDDTSESNDHFGGPLASSDFNGDGYGDLAVGIPGEDIGGKANAGAVQVFYGSSSGLQASSPNDQIWHQNVPGVEESNEVGDSTGSSLTSADFNGDGYGDLAVGTPGESVGDVGRAGAVNVIYGSSSGLQTSSPADQLWHQDSPGVEDSSEVKEFGFGLSSGDFNGDSNMDLVMGVSQESLGGLSGAGAVHVLYGSSSGITSSGAQFWHRDSPGVNGSAATSGLFGSGLSAKYQG